LDEAESFLAEDQARKAAATLAAAAAIHPEDRRLGASLYAVIRDHLWYLPQIFPITHKGPVTALAFSPDSTLLASGSAFGEVFISSTASLDKAAADALRITLMLESDIVGLAFAKDGQRLAAVTKGGGQIWSVADHKLLFQGPKDEDGVSVVAVARDGNQIAIGMNRGGIQVIDLPSAKLVAAWKAAEKKAVRALAFSRDGKKVASSVDNTARVWEAQSGQPLGREFTHPAPIRSVDFSYDDRYVLTAAQDGSAKLSDPESGQPVMPAMPCGASVLKASVSPDGSVIATLLEDASVVFWDAFTGNKLPIGIQEDLPILDFAWAQSGLRAATASQAGHAAMWTMRAGMRRGEVMPHRGPVLTMALSRDSKLMATGCEDGRARIWRIDGGMPLPTVRSHSARARSAAYSLDGKHLVTAAEDHTALHWVSGGVRPSGPALKHEAKVTCATFNPAATRILTCDDRGTVQWWDANTGQADGAPYRLAARANWVDVHPDGERFVVSSGASASVWSIANREKPLAVISHPGAGNTEMKNARFSPNGKWLATASTDGSARIWDAKTYQSAAAPIERGAPMLCVRFSPDSTRLVVAGEDGQAVVYDTATWQPVGVPILMPGPIFSALITGDNGFLTVASLLHDVVQFFDLNTGRAVGSGVPLPSQATCVDYLLQDKVVVVACDDGSVRAVESPFVSQDIPPWLCTFAERLVGLKKTAPDTFEVVESNLAQLQGQLVGEIQTSEQDFPRLARWALAFDNQRHGMPRFVSTIAANIERRVQELNVDALFECYEAVSGDPFVLSALSLYLPNRRQGEHLADLVLAMDKPEPLARGYAASTLVNAGRSAEAKRIVAQALADAPDDPRVLRRSAKIQARLADKHASLELFQKSLGIEPNNIDTIRGYAWVLYSFHEPAEAAKQFRRAQELVGEMNDDLLAGICLCAAAQQNDADAAAAYRKLIALDPAWAEAEQIEHLRGWTQQQLTELERVRKATLQRK
jgi:WD40 repeat protein/tetratricopeptide (TPR) repeat protein